MTSGMKIISLVVAVLAGWLVASWYYGEQYVSLQLRYESSQRSAEAKHREREHYLQQALENIERDAQNEKDRLEAIIRDGRSTSDGLQQQLSNLSDRYRKATSAADQCETELTAAALFTELLRESEYLAREYAKEADRVRIAGKACELAYDKVFNGQ